MTNFASRSLLDCELTTRQRRCPRYRQVRRRKKFPKWRAWCGRAWRWRAGRCASLGAAAPFVFAGVLAFGTVVAGLATALTLALVLAFASVFALFSISHRLERDPRMARGARCIGTHGQGSS